MYSERGLSVPVCGVDSSRAPAPGRAHPGTYSTSYLVTLACGMLRVPFALFAIAGLAGTISRYGFLAWFAAVLAAG